MKKNIFLLFVMFITCLYSQEKSGLRIIAKTERSLTAELVLPHFSVKEIIKQGMRYKRLKISHWGNTFIVGAPELPVKGILLHVPEKANVTYQILKANISQMKKCKIYPVPKIILDKNGIAKTQYFLDSQKYNRHYLPVIEMSKEKILRDICVRKVLIYPFQWNPNTHVLKYYTYLKFRLQYNKAFSRKEMKNVQNEKRFDEILKKVVCNYHKSNKITKEKTRKYEKTIDKNVKIVIKKEGVYRVSYNDLLRIGVKETISSHTIKLYNREREVAIRVVSDDVFMAGDYIEFYASKLDNKYTDENVYFLSFHGANGKRISTINSSVTEKYPKVVSYLSKIRFEENHCLWESLPESLDVDRWFWGKHTAPYKNSYNLNVPWPVSSIEKAKIRVSLYGRSTAPPHPNHHTLLYLNGNLIIDEFWDGEAPKIMEMEVASSMLKNGNNECLYELPGDTGAVIDIVYLNWFEIEYQRKLQATNNEIRFSLSLDGNYEVNVGNFEDEEVRVFDISDIYAIKEIKTSHVQRNAISFDYNFKTKKLFYGFGKTRYDKPHALSLVKDSGLRNPSNQADYIIITSSQFQGSFDALIALREKQGLRVKVAYIEDIYNEFYHGIFDPQAIKNFINYAYHNWASPSPTYLLMIGDASMDYRDFTKKGKKNFVPTYYSSSPNFRMNPDDNWYVCVEGDDILPDMIVGRLPGNNSLDVEHMIAKIVAYETSEAFSSSALFVSDGNDYSFSFLSDELIKYLPLGVSNTKLYLDSFHGDVELLKEKITSEISQGPSLISYVGHGATRRWGQDIFGTKDVDRLTNYNQYPVIFSWSCLNTYCAVWSFPYTISESFVIAKNKGAVAFFSSNCGTYMWEHELMSHKVFSDIFENHEYCIGNLTTFSKIYAYTQSGSEHILKRYALCGDPALRLKYKKEDK